MRLSKKSAARNPKQGSVKKNDTSLFFLSKKIW